MKTKNIILALVASTQFMVAGATSVTTIDTIYVYSTTAVVKMSSTHLNGDDCTDNDAETLILIKTDDEAGKKHYAAALSAQITGSKVRIGYRGCANLTSTTTIPVAYNISLSN